MASNSFAALKVCDSSCGYYCDTMGDKKKTKKSLKDQAKFSEHFQPISQENPSSQNSRAHSDQELHENTITSDSSIEQKSIPNHDQNEDQDT